MILENFPLVGFNLIHTSSFYTNWFEVSKHFQTPTLLFLLYDLLTKCSSLPRESPLNCLPRFSGPYHFNTLCTWVLLPFPLKPWRTHSRKSWESHYGQNTQNWNNTLPSLKTFSKSTQMNIYNLTKWRENQCTKKRNTNPKSYSSIQYIFPYKTIKMQNCLTRMCINLLRLAYYNSQPLECVFMVYI